MNILFVCSRNKKRSYTAETIFRELQGHTIYSGGTEENARQRVTEKMILKADIIFVMEKVHRDKLLHKYGALLSEKELVVLSIPDEYEYMDEELVDTLHDMMKVYL